MRGPASFAARACGSRPGGGRNRVDVGATCGQKACCLGCSELNNGTILIYCLYRAWPLARKKGWLSRISSQLLGDRMAYALDMYYDLDEAVDDPGPLARRHLPIAAATCLEQFYRQVGQRMFDLKKHMYTAVEISIVPADLPEFKRIVPLLNEADLFWLERRVQSAGDIQSVLDELGLTSPFAGDSGLLDNTHLLFRVRNNLVHGMGISGYSRHQILQTVRRHIEAILEQMPPLLAVFLLIGGKRADLRGDKEAAAAFYRKAIKEADRSGADPSVRHVIAGKACEGLGYRDEAIERYKKAAHADPGNANARAAMGCLLARDNLHEKALAEYDKAVEIEPGYASAHIGRGNTLLSLDRPDEALESYRLAAQADPSYAEAHIAAGAAHESQGRPDEALESYRLAAQADPSDAEAHIVAGKLHESQGRPDEALESYRLAAQADPSDAEAHIVAGKLHESQGRPGEALESYRLAAQADPSSAMAHIAAGKLHESRGNRAGALESYRLAAQADPLYAVPNIAASALNEALGNLPESMPGYAAAASPANAGRGPPGGAQVRVLERRGYLSDADDMTRHIRHPKRGHYDDGDK